MQRETKETKIQAEWHLDAPGKSDIATGIGFFDHMLEALAKHSGTSIVCRCDGDLHIDGHHTTEDCGIALGKCLREALGDRCGAERFGFMAAPLDEALVQATIDLSGRSFLHCGLSIPAQRIGEWDTELVLEFFTGLVDNAKITLHIDQVRGVNSHHIVEAAFKAVARSLRQAIEITGDDMPSTKGVLA